jgi:[FeFe] hydrogenase H-cluster maturation GTPase HydF
MLNMDKTPKSLRLYIGIFGRMNTGKSSFLNLVSGQDVSITSDIPGTTTDVVEKTMELLPVGPVVFLDTAGIDDKTELGNLRIKKTNNVFDKSDIVLLVIEPNKWTEYEENIFEISKLKKLPLIVIINKIDFEKPSGKFIEFLNTKTKYILECSSIDKKNRDKYVNIFKKYVIDTCPEDFLKTSLLIGDLIEKNGIVVLITPIDKEAPKGRLILPEVQTIRDSLDNDAVCVVVKESEYIHALKQLKKDPDIVVCDSQVVLKMVNETPKNVKCTTFSILFARLKGELEEFVKGAKALSQLKDNDKVLVFEACSHHAIEDDIGRIKMPRWIKEHINKNIIFDVCAGSDYPTNLEDYKLIIHCGGCMINRRFMLSRIQKAKEKNIPITNYGVIISYTQGVLERVLEPFPNALEIYRKS